MFPNTSLPHAKGCSRSLRTRRNWQVPSILQRIRTVKVRPLPGTLQKHFDYRNRKRIVWCLTKSQKKAVNDAIRAPRAINENLFSAQQARRVLDRLVGYSVSPAISKLANARLSAGRVQSIAVKLVAERDAQIKAFVSTDHFGVMITVNGHQAKWETKPFITDPDFPYITDKGIAGAVMETNQVRVIRYQQGERLKQPPKTVYDIGFMSRSVE